LLSEIIAHFSQTTISVAFSLAPAIVVHCL
jgi:hypothetical protein